MTLCENDILIKLNVMGDNNARVSNRQAKFLKHLAKIPSHFPGFGSADPMNSGCIAGNQETIRFDDVRTGCRLPASFVICFPGNLN